MINSLVRIGIICPCDIEYQSCKEILKLHNETELAGRLISSRREKDVEVIAIKAGPGKICIFRKDPDTVSGNIRTAFRNYPDTLSNH